MEEDDDADYIYIYIYIYICSILDIAVTAEFSLRVNFSVLYYIDFMTKNASRRCSNPHILREAG